MFRDVISVEMHVYVWRFYVFVEVHVCVEVCDCV